MAVFENVWWLLVLIGVMILIHELGHFWVARLFDVRVDTFSFGFGPRLFGFRRGETDYRVSAIPFGGYVKMAGEQPGEELTDDPRGFLAKPRWQRLFIAFAGPAMNIVLAIALLTGLYTVKYQRVPNDNGPVTIGHVQPDSPAAKAGVREGDRIVNLDGTIDPKWDDVFLKEVSSANRPMMLILQRDGQQIRTTVTPTMDEKTGAGFAGWSTQLEIQVAGILPNMDAERAGIKKGDILLAVNGQPIRSTQKLHDVIRAANGAPVDILISRNGERHKFSVQPAKTTLDGQERWMIGVQLEPRVITSKLPLNQAFIESVRSNAKNATMIYSLLRNMIERRMSPKSLTGPIGMAQMSGEAAREGAAVFIGWMAMVSLNLAIFNLLPIPILDGGVILLLLVEMVMRRDLSLQVKEAVFKLGFVFLMALVVFVLYNDITKILPPG